LYSENSIGEDTLANVACASCIYSPYRDRIYVLLVSPMTNSAVQTLH